MYIYPHWLAFLSPGFRERYFGADITSSVYDTLVDHLVSDHRRPSYQEWTTTQCWTKCCSMGRALIRSCPASPSPGQARSHVVIGGRGWGELSSPGWRPGGGVVSRGWMWWINRRQGMDRMTRDYQSHNAPRDPNVQPVIPAEWPANAAGTWPLTGGQRPVPGIHRDQQLRGVRSQTNGLHFSGAGLLQVWERLYRPQNERHFMKNAWPARGAPV